MSLGYEPRIVKAPVSDGLEKMAKRAQGDDTRDRARRVAKVLGMDRGLRGDQSMAKGASDFYSPQFKTSQHHFTADMPNLRDVEVLQDPAVSPELRAAIIEKSKRRQRSSSAAFEKSVTPIRNAIDDLVESNGIKFQALHRLLGVHRFDTTGDDDIFEQMAGRSFAKSDLGGLAQRSRDIDVLMKASMPESMRRKAIVLKNAFDDMTPGVRRKMRDDSGVIELLEDIEALRDGVQLAAAVNRLLS